MKIMNRRRFLMGSGAVLALPRLDSLPALRPRTNDVRGVWIYFPNGVAEGSWRPRRVSSSGRLERLSATQAPFESLREHLLLPERIHTPRGNGHGAGTATWLTGGHWDERAFSAGGVSVDQIAARDVGRDRVAPSLVLATKGEGFFAADLPRNHVSWSGEQRPMFRETDPRAVFERLFGAGPEADRSLLDSMRQQAADLKRRLGRADQRKLDEYLDAVRGIERRIAFASDAATAKKLEEARQFGLGAPEAGIPEDHGAYVDTMFDLLALALWTGATRVATFMLDHGQSNRYCPFVPGVKGTWHALSHWRDIDGETEDDDGVTSWSSRRSKRQMYDAVVRWHHERVARFLTKLDSLPDGDGTLLDQSVVVYGSSLSDGHEHGDEDLPLLIAGRAGGAIRPGRVIRSRQNVSLSRVHLASLRALGVRTDRFAETSSPIAWG